MNNFDEHTWDEAQRNLDARICLEFEALEASYAGHELTDTLDEWRKSAEGQVITLRAQIVRIAHTPRRKHWDDELARLGFTKKKAKPEAVAAALAVATTELPPAEPPPSDG